MNDNEEFQLDNISSEDLGNIIEVGDTYSKWSESASDEVANNLNTSFNEIFSKYPQALIHLLKGYISYCAEVIVNRAIPGIDGLKPVQRRILYSMKNDKVYSFTKCKKVASAVMSFHPHSDTPIYEASVRLTDIRGTVNIPLIKGKGTFGKYYSSDGAADSRYTECYLHSNSDDLFGEMQGVNYVENYDNTEIEPTLLPVSYPLILVNQTEGIAVGIASNIPSFNILDVLTLFEERILYGRCKSVIAPDHKAGAFIVKNNEEFYKLMTNGKASIKTRARVEISGKEIKITELPIGVTAEEVKKEILQLNLEGIKEVKNLDGMDGMNLKVYCTSANRVEGILLSLYRYTSLQTNISANMTVIINNEPKLLGVWSIIDEFYKFRYGVIEKQLLHDKDVILKRARVLKARADFLEKGEIIDTFYSTIRGKGKKVAKKFIQDSFPNFEKEDVDSVLKLGIDEFNDHQEYLSKYNVQIADALIIDKKLNNIDEIMLQQTKRNKSKFSNMTRKTEITTKDYIFRDESSTIIDDSPCYFVYKDNFIKKLSIGSYINKDNYDLVLECNANSVIIGIDTNGRIIRVYMNELQYMNSTEIGVYLPRYLDIEENEIVWLDVLTDTRKMVVYSDGKLGFIDQSEWYGNTRQVKVIERGISVNANKVIDVVNVPEVIAIITEKGAFSWESTEDIRQGTRTSQTSVFKLTKDDSIKYCAYMTKRELYNTVNNMQKYIAPKVGKLISKTDIKDLSKFTRLV